MGKGRGRKGRRSRVTLSRDRKGVPRDVLVPLVPRGRGAPGGGSNISYEMTFPKNVLAAAEMLNEGKVIYVRLKIKPGYRTFEGELLTPEDARDLVRSELGLDLLGRGDGDE